MRLIDADALIQSLKSNCKPELCHDCGSNWCEYCCPHNDYVDLIDNAPTVEARLNGEWIIVKDERYGDNVKCPFCEKELAGTDLNFCCKCGAKLAGNEKMNGDAE